MKKTLLTLAMILGSLTGVQAQARLLTLDDSKDLTPVINAAAETGGTYNIRFSSRDVNVNNWNVLCLPFDVTPAQVSNAFGYAAVDRLIEDNDDGNIHFEQSVSGTIPAGTPFLVHVGDTYKTKDNFKKVITFTGVTVKKVEASTTVTDACGNRFVGIFSPKDVWGRKIWYMSKGAWYDARRFSEGNPVSLKPMRCYIDFSGNTVKARPQIIIDEPDGTTTAIDVATFNEGEFSTEAGAQAQAKLLTLDDSKDLTPVINAAAERGGTYNIRFGSRDVIVNNWDVLCLPFDVTPAQISNAFGYAAVARLIENGDDGDIHFELAVSGTIPAGTPFLMNVGDTYKTKDNFKKVVSFTGVTVNKVEASTTLTDASGNRFISTFSPVELTGGHFWYLSEGEWHEAEEPVALKPLRCYIDVSGNTTTETPQIIIDDPGGETAIFSVKTGSSSKKGVLHNGWFTLTGTRLTEAPAAKGIYIHQGQKVVIR